jgi:MFS family permease
MIIPVMAGLIAAFGKNADGGANVDAIVWIFIVVYAVYWTADGMFTIVWADMLGSSLPDRLRSLLYTFGQLGTALGAFAAREILNFLLGPNAPPFPDNYAVLFLIWGVMTVLGGLCLANLKEEQHADVITPGPSFREFMPYVGSVLRDDGQFRHFILMRLMFDFSTLAMPFYVLIATDVLKRPRAEFVGDSVLMVSLGSIVASVVLGWMSRRSGSRSVVRASSIAKIGMPVLGLLSLWTGNAALLLGVFALIGVANSAYAPGYFDWIITYAPNDRRPIYMGLTNTISAVGNVAPLIGGFILSLTGSYPALLWSALAISAIGALLTIGLIEPRRTRSAQPGR